MAAGNIFDDITTRDLIAIVREWRTGRLHANATNGTQPLIYQQSLPFFSNDSGEAIPPYACMQVTGTVTIGPQTYLVVEKPVDTDGTAGGFIFNGSREIADDSEGLAQLGPVFRGFKDTGTATGGDRWSPVSGQWYIEQDDGGHLICCGDDDIDTDVVKFTIASATTLYPIVRYGFNPVNAANAYNYDTTPTSSYANYTNYSGTGGNANITDSALGVTIAAQGGGAPANAEVLVFANAGTYVINLAYTIGANSSGCGINSETTIYETTTPITVGPIRRLTNGGGTVLFGNYIWVNDHRVVSLVAGQKLHISVATATTSGPTNEGKVTIFRTK